MRKVSYSASADIALVKYWGKKDEKLRLPENGSVAMSLDGLRTETTVEFREELEEDEVEIEGVKGERARGRVVKQLERIRKKAGREVYAKVRSRNNFPASTGLSSSSSGFAALTLAASEALGLEFGEKEASVLARKASGSACRCVVGGFVEWREGESDESSYAKQIYPASYWDLRDVVVVVEKEKKKTSSSEGHRRADSSLFYEVRQKRIDEKIERVKKAIKEKRFTSLGKLVEEEVLEFQSILLTSRPSELFLRAGSLQVMRAVRGLRKKGVEAYFTMNTGHNVHVLCLPEQEERVAKEMRGLSLVEKVIQTKVGEGPRKLDKHLF